MTIQSINPAMGEVLENFSETTGGEIDGILEAAFTAFLEWRRRPYMERAKRMREAGRILREGRAKYARTMALEMGKPIVQGEGEAEKCAWVCDYYAENAETLLAHQPRKTEASRSYIEFDPIGPVLAIMPWNFPFWQVFRFAAPALMAGNAGILKHASNVPRCALHIEEIFREAGFPENLFRAVLVGPEKVGAMIADPRIRAVTLTGSDSAGSKVAEQAGRQIKKTVLELGGSDPFIVLEDADVQKAAKTAADARLINSGQSCIAAKRFIVVEKVADAFERRFISEMRSRKMGDPLERDTQVGPQARHDLRAALHRQVEESVKRGAELLLGGQMPDGPGAFYPPTVLFGVSKGMPVFDEETFGPVAAVIRAQGDADAIRLANDSAFGLGASLWTRNGERAEDIAGDLDVGCVFVNEAVKSDPRLPFGGVKRSGYGRELSEYGIREFVNIKSVWMAQSGVESCEPTNSANSSAEANKKSKPLGDDSLDEEHLEEMIDETLAESFPASDPPSWTLGRERWKPSTGTESSAKTARAQTSTVKPKDKAGG
jgi:succinate-semialdehyde dehydrogenase/glutarate-semialdehyde dehydrogenase